MQTLVLHRLILTSINEPMELYDACELLLHLANAPYDRLTGVEGAQITDVKADIEGVLNAEQDVHIGQGIPVPCLVDPRIDIYLLHG